jgi:Tol biopolymer transport system component
MGEVYRARDQKLNRDVAIKVLLPDVADDPDRLARFTREAHVLASLNHPNIAHIYGVEDTGGTTALVMELVEGEDLSQRIGGRPVPLDEALPIARQIAEALEAAHDHGVIHRDLKPANIKLRADGTVKVLDFGLAKAIDPSAASSATAMNSPTLSIHATRAGIILGTAAYMSPEQARGKHVDKRTDIWALGCVLFEMLTGQRAFPGDDATDTIVAVVSKEPDWTQLPPATPPHVRTLLRRSLEKNPKRRLDSAAAVRIEIDDAAGGVAESSHSKPAGADRRSLWWAIAGAVIGALAVSAVYMMNVRGAAPPGGVTRTLVGVWPAGYLRSIPVDDSLGEGRASRSAFAISPDGRSIVFSGVTDGRQQLFLRTLDQLEATPLPGTDEGYSPFFSPDGQWIGFYAKNAIQKLLLAGGAPPTTVVESPALYGASWGTAGTIVYAAEKGGLWRVSAGGGIPHALTTVDSAKGEYSHRLPHFLPDGQTVLFTVTSIYLPRWDQTRLALITASGERRDLGLGADARYASSGHLLFMRSGTLVAAPFDADRGVLAGDAVTMIAEVGHAANMTNQAVDSGAGQFSVSNTGSLVYLPGGMFPDREVSVMVLDRRGIGRALPIPPRAYLAPLLSPDGTRLTVWTQGLDRNVWIYELARGTLTRLTSENRNHRGIWTPDGRRITYAGQADNGTYNLFWMPADGSGAPERLTTSDNNQTPSSWSPDGKTLVLLEDGAVVTDRRIVRLSMDGSRQTDVLMKPRSGSAVAYPELSHDGRWLAYVSSESGREEVYVQPHAGDGGRKQISTDGGRAPAWSRDQRQLYYTTTGPAVAYDDGSNHARCGAGGRRAAAIVRRTVPRASVDARLRRQP